MKQIIQDEVYGEIVYCESFWLGRKSITFNGAQLQRISKKQFQTEDGNVISVCGNFYTGLSLQIGDRTLTVTQKVKWYEIVLCILPLVLNLIWGNVYALCEIVPIVGGAIGGAISGVLSVVSLYLIKNVKPVWLKIIIAVVCTGVMFGLCCGVAYIILSLA